MRPMIVVTAFFVLQASVAHSAFTDFSDYAQTTAFATGESFSSQDLSFQAVKMRPGDFPNPTRIWADTNSFLYPGAGVALQLPAGTAEVSMKYEAGAGTLIAINGVEPATYPGQNGTPYQAGFGFLNGTTLGGVNVITSLTIDHEGYEVGTLTLKGPISLLAIAGLELTVDDVTALVPEPHSAILLLVTSTAIARRRRRG